MDSDYDSEDDSDYAPPDHSESDEEESSEEDSDFVVDDVPTYENPPEELVGVAEVSDPSPIRDDPDTPQLIPTYRDMIRRARTDNLESFEYTPKSGPRKNVIQTYDRKVASSGLIYYKRRCV